jgi:hypothetical protein
MIKMPWNNATAPNLMLEITDACNISCRACYKKPGKTFKNRAQVEQDLNDAMRLRKLHTVTLTGGEPTLHPDLLSIIKTISSKGLHSFLLTNGLLVDSKMTQALKDAGLDSILFHVDSGQVREDLPGHASFSDIKARLNQLVDSAHSCGLDISISFTLYDADDDLEQISRYFFDRPELTFLFVARGVDPETFYRQKCPEATGQESRQIDTTIDFYQQHYGIQPFSYIPGTSGKPTVWISFFVPVIYHEKGPTLFRVKAGFADSLLMRLPKLLTGRYVHKTTHNPKITLLRTLVNAVGSLRIWPLLKFTRQLFSGGARLHQKTIVYDDGPYFSDDELIHCEYCPTAIVRDGEILNCCTADYYGTKG